MSDDSEERCYVYAKVTGVGEVTAQHQDASVSELRDAASEMLDEVCEKSVSQNERGVQ